MPAACSTCGQYFVTDLQIMHIWPDIDNFSNKFMAHTKFVLVRIIIGLAYLIAAVIIAGLVRGLKSS